MFVGQRFLLLLGKTLLGINEYLSPIFIDRLCLKIDFLCLKIDFLCLKIDFHAPVLRLKNQTKDFFTFWLKFWSNWLHPQEVYCYGKKIARGETECWVRLRLALCRG